MKKVLVFLLALCMLLTLCACTDPNEEAFESAKALYDAGDYENAIEALQSLNHYAEITDMIADAQKQITAENYGFLYTTWVNAADDGSTLIFRDTGICDIVNGYSVQYTMENDKITVAGIVELTITQEDGIYHLVRGDDIDLVREADYDQFIAEHTVELTLDNYLDYFEWADEREEDADDSVFIMHYLQLKDAFKNRINLDLSEAEVEKTYERSFFWGENFTINFDTLEYSGISYSETETINGTSSLEAASLETAEIDFFICSDHYCMDGDSVGYVYICSDPEITRVEGHLVIR